MIRFSASIGAAALLLAGAAARAQDSVETVVVTGTRLPGAINANDPNVTVLDADDIAARDAASAVDLLRTLPGVFVQQAGGRGSVVSLFTRGAKPNFTLVLIDGVKANDPTNTRGGSFDASTLSLDDIARIEFVRGPASAVYGSDAVGGVINFITRRPDGTQGLDAEAQAGSSGYLHAAVHVAGELAGIAARAGAAYDDAGTPVEGSVLRSTTVDGALAAEPLGGLSLSLDGRFNTSRAGAFPDSSGGPLLAVLRATDRRDIEEAVVAGKAAYDAGGDWRLALDYGLYDRWSKAVSPGVAPSVYTPTGIPPNSDAVHFMRNQVTASARFAPGPDFAAVLGIDVQDENGVDDGTLKFGAFMLPERFALDRTTVAGFAEIEYAPVERLRLSGGARLDGATDGTHFSPQLGASYDVAATGTRLELHWGRGFKLPSFYALGNPIVGDPSLRPEHATNIDAGLTQSFAGGLLKLDWYDTRYSDLIDFRPGPVPKLVNLSRVHVQGAEASVELHFGPDLILTPALSFTDARNVTTGAALRDVPAWLVSGEARWTPRDDLSFSATLLETGTMTDNAIPTGDERLPSHARLDLAGRWQATARWALYAAIDNVLDSRDSDVIGFPAPGRAVRAGVKLTE